LSTAEVVIFDVEDQDAAVSRLLAARTEQGLSPTITDPVALDRAAVLFQKETAK
jgi:hypothetical protein